MNNRIGLTATKKIGNSVRRNRVKRRLRALWRESQWAHGNDGLDIVFIAKHSVATANFQELAQEIEAKIGAFHGIE